MRTVARRVLIVVLFMGIFLISTQLQAKEPPPGDKTSGVIKETAIIVPDLGDIMPQASKLSGRLEYLEARVTALLDLLALESRYTEIEANLNRHVDQFKGLQDSKDYSLKKLMGLRAAIGEEQESFEKISTPLSKKISEVNLWRKEWLAEKKRWNEWQSSILKDAAFDQLRPTFAEAEEIIDTALALVLQQLKAMLTIQERARRIRSTIYSHNTELEVLISAERHVTKIGTSPPMLSSRYYSQFRGELRYAVKKGMAEMVWIDSHSLARKGWVLLLQAVLSLFVFIALFRNRQSLKDSKRWGLLAERPFSAALFLGAMATLFLHDYGGAFNAGRLILDIIGMFSFARLIGGLSERSEIGQFVYGLFIVGIFIRFLELISLPLPLFRLGTVCAALVFFVFSLRWAKESGKRKDSRLYFWGFRSFSLLMAVIIIAEVLGKHGLASYLFTSSLLTIVTIAGFVLFSYIIRGAIEWIFRASPLKRAAALYKDTNIIIRRTKILIDLSLWGLILLPGILFIWRVYDSLGEAIHGLLAFGFSLGTQRITVGLVITSAGILYASFIISWIFQKLLTDQVLARRNVEMGVKHAMARLIHYCIVFLGFMIAISALGFEVTKLTIILSALGVGIGFGLQGVVNNFVSGIILLFERPVRVGDIIEFGGKWSEIKRIGLRATTVQTFDHADVIIPNADLVANQVTNWTLSSRRVRLIIRVGVAYGSDVPLVVETLKACAKTTSMMAKTPEPQVLFLSFGESSLDFELRVWALDVGERLNIQSELHQEIDRRFREAKIEIAFPQRDLHLRSVDESIHLPPQKTSG